MATKSLDNIFARQLTSSTGEQGSKVATRSEEQLYYASYSLPGAVCPAHKASRFSGARYVENYLFILLYLKFAEQTPVKLYYLCFSS
jgi:hypothetical protein